MHQLLRAGFSFYVTVIWSITVGPSWCQLIGDHPPFSPLCGGRWVGWDQCYLYHQPLCWPSRLSKCRNTSQQCSWLPIILRVRGRGCNFTYNVRPIYGADRPKCLHHSWLINKKKIWAISGLSFGSSVRTMKCATQRQIEIGHGCHGWGRYLIEAETK